MPLTISEPQITKSIANPAVGVGQTVGRKVGVKVADTQGMPIKGAHVLLILKNGTHLGAFTDQEGLAQLSTPEQDPGAVFCAHDGFSAFYKIQYNPVKPLLIRLNASLGGGSVIISDGTGTIPGLEGRLNPILDSLGRTYLYADNIAVDGGKTQPVEFTINNPFKVRDSQGHSFELEIVAIIGRSSLIQYKRL